jgi:guanosine-3',5'-bis(diphosphate) 3'-pyrophosphohydrolase
VKLFKPLKPKLNYLPDESVEKIIEAYTVAEQAHRKQTRQSGEPYITHPVAVAGFLADMHMDPQTIMAALLHDVIEDTPISKKELADQFGKTVAELVDGVSKLTRIETQTKVDAQAENFHKMVMAMSKDIRVVIIKLNDRLHNMRTLGVLRPDKRRRIAKETLEIYAPIAARLGMHEISNELQNLGFAALYPERYRVLENTVRRAVGNQKKIIHLVKKTISRTLAHHNLLHCEVVGRQKNLYSIYKKMRVRGLSFKEVTDVYGFRIITDTVDNAYRVLGLVHAAYKPLPERFKDYIAIPKANGYQSLHTSLFGPFGVPIEVQIRTREMDQIANSGIAAHWLYKSEHKTLDEAQLRAQQWVENLLELQKKTATSAEFIENVKVDLFPDEVYVFTPQGDIKELPKGATVIDFAYMVHTDVGNACVAARVDRNLAPLSSVLVSGQTVEIITSATGRPHPTWLDFIVTARARSAIRHYLKGQKRSQSVALGKELLEKSLERLSLSIKKVPNKVMQALLHEARLENLDDLLEELGLGNRMAMFVAHQIAGEIANNKKKRKPEDKKEEVSELKPLTIKGTEGMVVHFASCCYPIPGDAVIGILTAGQGLLVHLRDCKRIPKKQRQSEHCIPISWAKTVEGLFFVPISVVGVNRHGVLAKLAQAISDADANIDDINIVERDMHHYSVIFKIQVSSRKHLATVLRNVHRIKSVLKVVRK